MLVLFAALCAPRSAHGQNLTYRYIGNPFSLSYCELTGVPAVECVKGNITAFVTFTGIAADYTGTANASNIVAFAISGSGNEVTITSTTPNYCYDSGPNFTFSSGAIVRWNFGVAVATPPCGNTAPIEYLITDNPSGGYDLSEYYAGPSSRSEGINNTPGTWEFYGNQPALDPKTLGCPRCQVGEPINTATGNVFEQTTDYTTAGPNRLSFTRFYNSMGVYSNPATLALTLGSNWRSNYDRYLDIYASGTTVTAERPDGQVLTFTLLGGTWTPDTDVDYTLTHSGSTWTLTDPNDTVETYAATNNVAMPQTIVARNGYTQNLGYSGGLLSTVTDSYSRTLSFTYSSGGLLQTVTTPDTLVLTYGFTAVASGNALTSVSYNTSPVTRLTYAYNDASLPFALTGVTDENGNTYQTWDYDSLGRATSNYMGGSSLSANLTSLSYGSGATTVTNALGVADTYIFATLQGVPKVTGISRAATSTTAAATETFGYDANGYLNKKTDWKGNQTTYVNNTHGEPTTINEAVGSSVARTTTIAYGAPSGACTTYVHLSCTITATGVTSSFTYDSHGNPLTRKDADTTTNTSPYSTSGQTRVTKWTWSSTGQEESVQLPRTDVTAKTTFGYNGKGVVSSITDALGHETQITNHTGGGLPLTIVDPNGVTTTLAYDKRFNLHTRTLSTTAGNLVTTWTHDLANNLTAVELPDKSKLTYGYDTAHRLTGTTDLFGHTTAYTLDALGDQTLLQVKNASGTVTQQHSASFDALGRMLTDVGGVGQTTTITYDNNGNTLTVTPPSPSGAVTYSYDALNRLSTAKDPSPGGTTTNAYDAHDRVLSVQDANSHTTAYVYNGFGDRTQTASPDSGTTVYHSDADRNLTQVVKPGPLTANMTYDALDRPLATTYPSDATLNVSRTYDQTGHGFGVGRLTSATDQVGSLGLTYDERGNVTQESRTVTGTGTLLTGTVYDAASRLVGIDYPSGTLVAYGRDSMGRVISVMAQPPGATTLSDVVTGVTYEPFGPETGLTYGNGITGAYGYDLDYRPIKRTDTGTSPVQKLSYAYYANNSVKTITDGVNAANTQALGYDTLDRLTSAVSGAGGYGTQSFTWDAVSNIKTQLAAGISTTYTLAPGSNRLAQFTMAGMTETVASTPAGNINILTMGGMVLGTGTYNQANELASEQTPSTFASYKYDLAGQRLEKALPGSNPIFYQFSRTGGELLSENDQHEGQTADYIYLNGKPIGEVNPTTGKLYFTHTDRLGIPQKLTDANQATAWSTLYEPFGSTDSTLAISLATQSLRLPGQQYDPETGLNHNGFRDYAAGLTRYVDSDPIGLEGGMNTYEYVGGNPLKAIDPTGQSLVSNFIEDQVFSRLFGTSLSSALNRTFPSLSPCEANTISDFLIDLGTATVQPEVGFASLAYDFNFDVINPPQSSTTSPPLSITIYAPHESER